MIALLFILWILLSAVAIIDARLTYGRYTWKQFILSRGALFSNSKLNVDENTGSQLPESAKFQRHAWWHYPSYKKPEWVRFTAALLWPVFGLFMVHDYWLMWTLFWTDKDAKLMWMWVNSSVFMYTWTLGMVWMMVELFVEMGTRRAYEITVFSILPIGGLWCLYPRIQFTMATSTAVMMCHIFHTKIKANDRLALAVLFTAPYFILICLFSWLNNELWFIDLFPWLNKERWLLAVATFVLFPFQVIQYFTLNKIHENYLRDSGISLWGILFSLGNTNKKTDKSNDDSSSSSERDSITRTV